MGSLLLHENQFVTDQEKIAELAKCVVETLTMPKRWSGIMGREGKFKHWVWHFCDSLEKCGYDVDRNAVSQHHFKTPSVRSTV